MSVLITTAVLGLLLIIIGISNMMGNIYSVHWYHRHRVTPENVKPFGKLVGIGTGLIGIAMIIFGILHLVYLKTQAELLLTVGSAILIICAIIGIAISFYAMIKYNKGIF
ncbi:MAG: hypothetical protein J6D42_01360 [Clostridia bacterium]|nr:hypothetical protein [Clostridia bacterium]MBQ2720900.1 hypothetical protein [Clostridia bacterium]